MWAAIKKAINSTIGTGASKPLDVQIKNGNYKTFYDIIDFLTRGAGEAHLDTSSYTVDISKYSNSSYKIIILPPDVHIIGNNAFYNCQQLEKITIPSSVYMIGNDAFSDCRSMKEVRFLPESSLHTIGDRAFMNCESLTSITIPKNVTSLDATTFSGCTNLMDIYVPWQEGAVEGAPWGAPNDDVLVIYGWSGE